MNTIVKIHGNSGSGKTTIIRNLFDQAEAVTKLGPNISKPEAYSFHIPGIQLPIHVVGSYENTCGGVDTISNMDELVHLIHKYAPHGNVIYEGLLVSTYFGSAGRAMASYGDSHLWAFLDTPLEVCIERVKARRLAAGNTKPFNEENTRNRDKPIKALREKLIKYGANVIDLNYDKDPTSQLLEYMK